VIIAAGLESTDLIEIAGLICRRQGIVVSVGSAGQDQSCGIYSERKLKLRATGSFHPGPMDSAGGGQTGDRSYEGNVFTEEDDQKSFMSLISRGAIEVGSLISHNFGIGRIEEAREIMSRYRKDECQCVIFNYDRRVKRTGSKLAMPGWSSIRPGRGSQISMGLIGVDDVDSEAEGVLAENEAGQSGFEVIRSEAENLIKEPTIDSVYIANIRNQYAEWVVKSLLSGKATFVDGCLCMREEEMEQIEAARLAAGAPLMVGYRRRFAPLAAKAREIVRGRRYPLSLHYRINRKPTISSDPYRNPQDDCRPITDEMCNHVDLLSYLVGGWPVRIHAEALSMPDDKYRCDDNLQVIIRFSEGSVGTINYVSSGNQLIASEYLEIMGDGMVIQLDDFRSLIIASEGKIRKSEATVRDTGKMRMLRLWHYYLVTGLGSPIPFDVIRDASLSSLGIIESLSEGNSAKLTD
jgi:predicted dehydrogenase